MIEREAGSSEEKKARSVLDFTFKKLDEVIANTATDLEGEKGGSDRESADKDKPAADSAHRNEDA